MGDAQFDQDCVREEWEGKQRRIEERNDEQSAAAESHDQALQPHEYFSPPHMCKMLLEIRTIVTDFPRCSGPRAIPPHIRKLLYLIRSVRICA
jgi:hypothetical protein